MSTAKPFYVYKGNGTAEYTEYDTEAEAMGKNPGALVFSSVAHCATDASRAAQAADDEGWQSWPLPIVAMRELRQLHTNALHATPGTRRWVAFTDAMLANFVAIYDICYAVQSRNHDLFRALKRAEDTIKLYPSWTDASQQWIEHLPVGQEIEFMVRARVSFDANFVASELKCWRDLGTNFFNSTESEE